MYPFEFTPHVVEAIWGGNALVTRYGKPGDANAKLGESWECWNENVVASGDFAGKTLSELTRLMGPALVGIVPLADRASFPILTKIIDAHESLSVQVHPEDAYARRVERQPNGKTECWIILEAKAGAELILGFTKDTDATEYRRRVQDGTLGEILRRVPVKAGDIFHIPAGTLHAIGAGIVIFETQQTSATTYRIFDWNRVDAAGKPRELHVDKAADVLDFSRSTRGAIVPVAYKYLGLERDLLIADSRFGIESLAITTGPSRYLLEATATVFFAQETAVTIRALTDTLTLAPWQSVLIPAGMDRVELRAESATKILAITTPGADSRARKRLALAGVDAAATATFLEQFQDLPRNAA